MEAIIARLTETIESAEAIEPDGAAESIRSDVLPSVLSLAVLSHQVFVDLYTRLKDLRETVEVLEERADESQPADTVIEAGMAEKLVLYMQSTSQIIGSKLQTGNERDILLQAAAGLIQFVQDHAVELAGEDEEEEGEPDAA